MRDNKKDSPKAYLTLDEVNDLLFVLDDADNPALHTAKGQRVLKLWQELHHWRLGHDTYRRDVSNALSSTPSQHV